MLLLLTPQSSLLFSWVIPFTLFFVMTCRFYFVSWCWYQNRHWCIMMMMIIPEIFFSEINNLFIYLCQLSLCSSFSFFSDVESCFIVTKKLESLMLRRKIMYGDYVCPYVSCKIVDNDPDFCVEWVRFVQKPTREMLNMGLKYRDDWLFYEK